jgi:hypothetical protein
MSEMAAWGTMPKRKLIDGHYYEYSASYSARHDAKYAARRFRMDEGVFSRVVIQKVNGYNRYHVYVRGENP